MGIKWRLHENILGACLTAQFILATILRDRNFGEELVSKIYAAPFRQRQVEFSYFRNVLWPDVIFSLAMVGVLLYFNLYIVVLLKSKKDLTKGVLHLIFLWILITIAATQNNFFINEYDFVSPLGNNKSFWIAFQRAMGVALTIVLPYLLYAFIREWIILSIERGSRAAYQILVTNRLTLIISVYLCILGFIIFFKVNAGANFFIPFLFYIPALTLSFFALLYGIYPNMNQDTFQDRNNVLKILGAIVFIAIPFSLLYKITMTSKGNMLNFLISCWIIQLFIVVPLSWFVYQRQKKYFDQLRGLKSKLAQSDADLSFLRSQMNPHFLFNALNTIYGSAIEEKADKTANAVQKLGDMMRFHMSEEETGRIELYTEIKYLEDFISFQKLRIPREAPLILEYDFSGAKVNHNIEPMLLIPFIENAFKHGLRITQSSSIKIILESNMKDIKLHVSNSLFEKSDTDPERDRQGIGLENVKRRLQILYPGKHQLQIESQFTSFTITLTISII